ncbi:MAG: DUF898 family protein [Pseudomonadota bacterium]
MYSQISYSGNPHKLFRLHIKTFLLSIITLGFYRFWGKTNIRNYVVGSFSINEHPFVYTGTAKELLHSFFKIIIFYILFSICYGLLDFFHCKIVFDILVAVLIFPLVFFAFLSSLRYRLSRTQFRGVSFHLTAPIKQLMTIILKTFALNVVTLGYLSYKTMPHRCKAIIEGISYGMTSFQSEPNAKNLYRIHLITWILAFFTFGFSRIWFYVYLNAEMVRTMKHENLTFEISITGWDVFKLQIVNIFITLLTLGLGIAYAHHRTYCFYAKRIQVIGDMEELRPREITDFSESAGEGMLDILGETSF